MANTTYFGWETPDDTDLVKDGAAAIRTLGQAIDTSMQDLEGGTTGQILAKNSNTDMDFIWVTNDVGDITEVVAGTGISGGGTSGSVTITNTVATEFDAKGDLVVGTGADTFDKLSAGTNDHRLVAASGETTGLKYVADTQNTVIDAAGDLVYGTAADTLGRLAIGTAGQVLKVNSGATAPEWGAAASGGYTLINSGGTALTGSATGVTSIPGTYQDLVIYIVDYYPSAIASLQWYLNNDDTGGNYQGAGIRQGLGAVNLDNAARELLGNNTDPADNQNSSMLYIPNYANTVAYKNISAMSFGECDGSPDAYQVSWYVSGYKSTSAIDSFYLKTSAGTFSGGTIFVYGVK